MNGYQLRALAKGVSSCRACSTFTALKFEYLRSKRAQLGCMQRPGHFLAVGRQLCSPFVRWSWPAGQLFPAHKPHESSCYAVSTSWWLRPALRGLGLPSPGRLRPRSTGRGARTKASRRAVVSHRDAEDAELACQLEPRFLKAHGEGSVTSHDLWAMQPTAAFGEAWIRRAAALAAANLRSEALEVLDQACRVYGSFAIASWSHPGAGSV